MRLEPQAEALATAYPPLLLAARRVAATLAPGLHGRRQAGAGEDFWQFRPYAQGDSTARIDWRKTARSGRVLIREREWAAANTLLVWSQSDAGMDWKSKLSPTTKKSRADLIAMTLAILAADAGERVGVLGASFAPGHSRQTLSRMAETLSNPQEFQALPPAVEMPRHGVLLLVGDFLAPIAELQTRLARLGERVAHAHLVEIADPAEASLPWSGRVDFRDLKSTAHRIFGHTENLRSAYQARLAEHRARLKDLTRKLGFTHALHHTNDSLGPLMMALHDRMGRA